MKFATRRIVVLLHLGAVFAATGVRAQEQPAPAATTQAAPQSPVTPVYEISGTARSGKTALPGVTVTASNTLTGKKYAVATNLEGKFVLSGMTGGRYVVRVEFLGFAVFTQEVVLNPENPSGKVEAELMLASRQQEQWSGAGAEIAAAGRGFQSLAVDSTLSALANGNLGSSAAGSGTDALGGAPSNRDLASLPVSGAGAEGPTESISVSGAQGRTQDFGNGSEEDLQQRVQEFRERLQRDGVLGQGQGPEGFGGGGGGAILAMGRGPRGGFNINKPHGIFYFSDDTSGLDARSYSLTGIPIAKPGYNQSRFGANIGGPLNIPKIFNGGNRWFFFVGWNGRRGDTPYDTFSTVPSQEERAGNFSNAIYPNGAPVQIFNAKTGQQYQFNGAPNVLDPSLISSSATALLQFIPLPNIATTASGQNFHYVTSAASTSDSFSVRLIHNLGSTTSTPGQGAGGGRGGRGGRRAQNNINFGLSWARSSTTLVNPFPSLAGGTSTQGLNATAAWVYGKGRATNNFRVGYNHNHVSTTNLYSNVTNVAGAAGITGISADSFDWGLPGISFTSFGGLNDPTPRRELDQTYTVSDTIIWNRGKHNWRFGGDYRRILQSFRSSRTAEGSFVFTGFATSQYAPGSTQATPNTGYDFADFLLGLPQQTSLQFGTTAYNFRSNAFDVFAQDDWRIRASLTLNYGLRYEYNGPYTEADNRIANLDVGPGFAAATPVLPGQTGAFNGAFPASLVRPDRNNFAPRIGLAWRPLKKTVVRAGYGINYNLAQYGIMIQNFAFQPPFASTSTNTTNVTSLISGTPLTLVNGFPSTVSAVTNNFAVNPDYRLGYVQIWNLDLQRELGGNVVLNVGYNGSKGTRLDTERALVVAGGQPFIYESSEGNSILHAASVRVRRRMSHGVGLGAQYVFSKSLDDASSIGGGGSVVAQNPFAVFDDRGLSSFDQTHRFTGNWVYDLPFGENRRFVPKGVLGHVVSGWQWSGDFTVASGFYFTPRVLGGAVDISRGVSGSLRANAVAGQPIAIADQNTLRWFNTAAFCDPSVNCVGTGGSFGDAGRNIIEGPGQVTFDMTLNRTITIKESRSLDLRISANNVFNHGNFSSLNTVVNSLTFGEITGVSTMRRVTLQARFRF